MTVKIITFGPISDITGKTTWEISGVKSTDGLIQKLIKEYPELQNSSYSIAINHQIIHADTILNENDTIALLPPFSGG